MGNLTSSEARIIDRSLSEATEKPINSLMGRIFQKLPSEDSLFRLGLVGREIALWCLLYLMAVAGTLYHLEGPRLSNDSYQYLSEAANIKNGAGLKTSIVHFDTERMSGRIPAPLTTFPPGYPLAIAGLAKMGLPTKLAGLILSGASFIFLVPLIVWAASLLEINAMVTRIVLVMLLGNATASAYATSVTTESLFTTCSLGALVCLLWHERQSGATVTTALVGNLLIAFAFWLRYAGLFLFVAAGIYLVCNAIARRDRLSRNAAACLALPASLIACLLVRNTELTGSWKGGNTKIVSHALMGVLKLFGTSTYHLFFGEGVPTRLGLTQMALALGLVLLFVVVARLTRNIGIHSVASNLFPLPTLLLVYIAVYDGCMTYLGVSSVISFGSRMFYPLLPVYLLLCGWFLTKFVDLSRARTGSLAYTLIAGIVVTSYCGINLECFLAQQPSSPDRAVEASFEMPNSMGESLSSWFEANVPPNAVIVATNGQATGYALKHKTVSLVSSLYSNQHWDEAQVRALMQQYKAGYLILYPGIDPALEPVQEESAFLGALTEGYRPQWLRLASRNNQVMILQRLEEK